jgi:hypothetical protein
MQALSQELKGAGALLDGGLNLVLGDRVTDTDVHRAKSKLLLMLIES